MSIEATALQVNMASNRKSFASLTVSKEFIINHVAFRIFVFIGDA